jgi:phage FluMu protein Com
MDPLDHRRAFPDGVSCTVCEEPVPGDNVRLLASREDVAFLQIDCPACRSTTLGFVPADAGPADDPRPASPPISADDVLDMHEFLSRWHGDLETLAR